MSKKSLKRKIESGCEKIGGVEWGMGAREILRGGGVALVVLLLLLLSLSSSSSSSSKYVNIQSVYFNMSYWG